MPSDPALTTSEEALRFLEERLELEHQHLDLLVNSRASWLERYRQRRAIERARSDVLWSETRTHGEDHYVWRHGVLGYGLPMLISTQILIPLGKHQLPRTLGELTANLFLGVIMWVIGGLLLGKWDWHKTEKRYAKTLAELDRVSRKGPA